MGQHQELARFALISDQLAMNVFVVHRFMDKKKVRKVIAVIRGHVAFRLHFAMLNNSGKASWKRRALSAISQSEVAIVFDREKCLASKNAQWEISELESRSIPVLDLSDSSDLGQVASDLQKYYDYANEFAKSFADKCDDRFELYKIMVQSSESLVERRQKTNAFFITIIGSLMAIGGLLNKFGVLTVDRAELVALYSIVAMLLCNSWWNLIDNYGKLNTAKFKVIGHLERMLGDQIFNAEWIALGKGKRSDKYRSFTETEKNVPLYMAVLFLLLGLAAILAKILG